MNKKGFTTVELILTMSIVIVIMSTITSVTYTYRDRSKHEEVISEVKNFKNSVTKIIYDDILDVGITGNGKVTKIEKVNNTSYNLVATTAGVEKKYNLTIINNPTEVGINYDGTKYIIPGSSSSLVEYKGSEMKPADGSDSNLYVLNIYFSHKNLDDQIKIHLVVSK